MALTVQLQLNPRAKPFVPTVKANKLLQHRHGKREEGEAPVSKHQTQLGRVSWASRRGEGEPNPPRETKTSGANGGRNWRTEVYVLMMWRLPLRQPYFKQQNGLRRRERPGCRRGDGGETPRQKQRSAWRRPRDEQPGSGRGLTPRTGS